MGVCLDLNLSSLLLSFLSPFDKDDQSSTASTVNKAPSVNKRFSTYNQSPPDTPSLREQAFYVSVPCTVHHAAHPRDTPYVTVAVSSG